MDQWELYTSAMMEAYTLGADGKDFNAYHFLKWHGLILPFGGTLRESNPVSVGMGESFNPAPCRELSSRMMCLITDWARAMRDTSDPYLSLATMHFKEWQTHFFPDGNKRHCRLLTIYGCGRYGLPPIDIALPNKHRYLDCLQASNLPALADLFIDCTIREE